MDKKNAISATGRRKCASARVRIDAGSGKIVVNGQKFEEYFETEALRGYVMQPLNVTGAAEAYDIDASVVGGGKAGQAGAIRHGIARALVLADENYKSVLKTNGMLTRDSRVKERKKPGQPGARRRFQFSKR